MFLRALAVITLLATLGLSGCGCPAYGPEPPAFKLCNGSRLIDEFAWFYADIQDTIFGIDYYADLNAEYGASPY